MTVPTPVIISSTERILGRRKRTENGMNSSTEELQSKDETSTIMTRSTGESSSKTDPSTSPLPSPFDNPLPNAFKVPSSDDSCPNFMNELLSDPAFQSCRPISMLIRSSTSFFEAQKELVSLVKVLDAACGAEVTRCTSYMRKAAQRLTTDGNCKLEFENNQTQVVEAWQGLRTYNILYSATCLQNPSSNSYCFANAFTNLTSPSDAYLYFLPYGSPLPSASTSSCGWCVQNTMSLYHSASANRGQLIASIYEDAANQINSLCGPDFANSTLPAAENGAVTVVVPSFSGVAASTLFVLFLYAWVS
ncbi:hypothetical protein NOR_06788 [Metarhizium rileyi]|uniref:DUF7729 domain-containing protein n=1 Tax=Metarhizium rileyi (strain RCEF 4871) TaxID=1649241 RepID=A0A166ZLR1_METRR|nr:hypothetical protein NOR_06788 [Metarhizium rileyi RCEF 4871]TWU76704.1 hypothetical protein ED733_002177 [Metarhizium rileyi]